jgi:hypothetical protein
MSIRKAESITEIGKSRHLTIFQLSDPDIQADNLTPVRASILDQWCLSGRKRSAKWTGQNDVGSSGGAGSIATHFPIAAVLTNRRATVNR